MSTQSKSVLVPFLIIAGVLFAAALGWKFFGANEAETVTEPAAVVTEVQPAVETKPAEVMATTQAKEDTVPPEPFLMPTEEDKKALKEVARSNMQLAMRYQTADQALKALEKFGKDGNTDMVKRIVAFMDKAFPNTAIPSEYLDL